MAIAVNYIARSGIDANELWKSQMGPPHQFNKVPTCGELIKHDFICFKNIFVLKIDIFCVYNGVQLKQN